MPIAPGVDDSVRGLEVLAVLEPADLGFGRAVNDADDLCLVTGPRVDERLLLLDLRRV